MDDDVTSDPHGVHPYLGPPRRGGRANPPGGPHSSPRSLCDAFSKGRRRAPRPQARNAGHAALRQYCYQCARRLVMYQRLSQRLTSLSSSATSYSSSSSSSRRRRHQGCGTLWRYDETRSQARRGKPTRTITSHCRGTTPSNSDACTPAATLATQEQRVCCKRVTIKGAHNPEATRAHPLARTFRKRV